MLIIGSNRTMNTDLKNKAFKGGILQRIKTYNIGNLNNYSMNEINLHIQ